MSADLDGMIGNLDVSASSVTDLKSEELPMVERNWDFEMKHIFILSSSGKPIFSKHGDEQSLSTTFGLIQAIVSIVENTGDRIVCIAAQKRRIVWFLRNSLYFVSISTSDEPEAVLSAQLEFMYDQIIFVLTSKVHEVLRLNPSKDIRDLLGYDTIKQMHLSCSENSTPAYVAFRAVTAFVCAEDLRIMIQLALKNCVDVSGSVFGVVLFRDQLLTFSTNATTDLELATSDFLLLANFVGKSNSLRSNDQNWVPICLPEFNPDAYVQAYICNIHLLGGTASKNLDISLVLISTSADPVMFNALHLGRQQFESRIQQSDIPDRLIIAFESQQAYLSIYSVPTSCLNFFTLLRPMLVSSKSSNKTAQKKSRSSSSKRVTVPASAPVQCHSFTPDNDSLSQSASDCDFTRYFLITQALPDCLLLLLHDTLLVRTHYLLTWHTVHLY
jgi:vacuolar fusion protein MON1